VNLRKVTHRVIIDYQLMLTSKAISLETKAQRIRAVKRLFEYLTDRNKLLINPTEGIVEICRKNCKPGIVLTVAEVEKLLTKPNLSMRLEIRDRAVMEVLYSTGIRIREFVKLDVHHVDFANKTLFIRKGKGQKQRVVPMGKNATKYLKEYLDKIRPRYAGKNPKERSMFLNHSGLPLTRRTVQGILHKYRTRAAIKKPVSPHTMRRTCATHMLQRGADIVFIQNLLGHSRLSVTQNYTKVIPVDVKKTHKKTHP